MTYREVSELVDKGWTKQEIQFHMRQSAKHTGKVVNDVTPTVYNPNAQRMAIWRRQHEGAKAALARRQE